MGLVFIELEREQKFSQHHYDLCHMKRCMATIFSASLHAFCTVGSLCWKSTFTVKQSFLISVDKRVKCSITMNSCTMFTLNRWSFWFGCFWITVISIRTLSVAFLQIIGYVTGPVISR